MNTSISKPRKKRENSNCLNPASALEMSFFWFNQNTNVNEKTGQPIVDPKKLKWFRNTQIPAGGFLRD